MKRKTLIYLALSLVLAAYCVMSLTLSNQAAATAMSVSPIVQINDSLSRRFVSQQRVREILAQAGIKLDSVTWRNIDTRRIEQLLSAETNIESARCHRLSNDRLLIEVTPMVPVIRVFDRNGHSYYVNREGKHLEASSDYHVDVPVVSGTFTRQRPATYVIPVADYISRDSVLNALVSMIQISPQGDIMLIPVIRGHVINMGDTTAIADKFERLNAMYRKVMPAKGWQYYDTLSLKYAGQVVATRRLKRMPEPLIRFDQPGDSLDEPDVDIMLTQDPPTAADSDTDSDPQPNN